MTHLRPLALAAALAAAAAAPARAEAPRPAADGVTSLALKVGEAVDLCRTGTLLCPAVAPICDDPSLVAFELTSAGLRFRGAKPGQTLCSARGAGGQGQRAVYRVTVAP